MFFSLKNILKSLLTVFSGLNIVGSFFFNYENIDDLPSDTKQQYTNIIKMIVYLFVEFVNSFNAKIETDYKLLLLETKVKKMNYS